MTLQELDSCIANWWHATRATVSQDCYLAAYGDDQDCRANHLRAASYEAVVARQVAAEMQRRFKAGTWYWWQDVDVKVDAGGMLWTRSAD